MTADKFTRRSQIIGHHLARIAAWRESGLCSGLLEPIDPLFRAVLQAQEHLPNAAGQLLEELQYRIAT